MARSDNDHAKNTVQRRKLYPLPNGKQVEIRALGLRDYIQAREECLAQYKRERLKTYTANVDLLDPEDRKRLLGEAFERVELITLEDLPARKMALPTRSKAGKIRRDADGEMVTKITAVEYTAWWMSETPEGRLFMTWLSIHKSDPDFTLEDADEIFRDAQEELEKIADDVGDLSGPQLGNSPGPSTDPTPATAKREARKRRRRRIGR
jgi:hypothetical protein